MGVRRGKEERDWGRWGLRDGRGPERPNGRRVESRQKYRREEKESKGPREINRE